MKTHHCGELRLADNSTSVVLCGWVNNNRDLGGLNFIDLRDKYGITQLSFDQFTGDMGILKKCYAETVLMIKGTVAKRPAAAINKKRDTGEIEIKVSHLEILSQCNIESLPFLPHGKNQANDDLRLKYRYLDLRTEKLQNVLKRRSEVTLAVREFLVAEEFIEVETPILYKSTPEGARDYVVPSRVHPGHVYALPQSPQTLKQLLMIGGTDKYFQICRCFRDEDLRADRQPEFSQIDIEVSYVTPEYIKILVENMFKIIFDLADDFEMPRMSYNDAMRDYGCDKPDVRFGLKHIICNDVFATSDFKVFEQALALKNGLIKALFIPSSFATFSRKDLDGMGEIVRPHAGKGVAFFKVSDGVRSGGISKFISDENFNQLTALQDNNETGDGTWLFVADDEDVAHASTDALRKALAIKCNIIQAGYKFLWIYDFPLLEWKESEKRFYAKHHPFTMPKAEQVDAFLNNEIDNAHEFFKHLPAEAYDVVCNGYELGGGSIRIHRKDIQNKMFSVLGMQEAEIKSQFGFFIEALSYGTPPHGGVAFGLDRIMMLLTGGEYIRDVMAFPKTSSATDLMSGSPSIPAKNQTDELSFKWL